VSMWTSPVNQSLGPLAVSSEFLVICIALPPIWLGVDHHLERLSIGHRAITVRDAIEVDGAVQDLARLDPAFEDVRQELLDIGAGRRRSAADLDVAKERGKR